MLKRILSVLLCAALLLGGTALAAKEDDYTLPELLYSSLLCRITPFEAQLRLRRPARRRGWISCCR